MDRKGALALFTVAGLLFAAPGALLIGDGVLFLGRAQPAAGELRGVSSPVATHQRYGAPSWTDDSVRVWYRAGGAEHFVDLPRTTPFHGTLHGGDPIPLWVDPSRPELVTIASAGDLFLMPVVLLLAPLTAAVVLVGRVLSTRPPEG